MNKLSLVGIVVTALLVAGCSKKEPEIDLEAQNANATENIEEADSDVNKIRAIDEDGVDGQGGNTDGTESADEGELSKEELQKRLEIIYFDFDRFNIKGDMEEVANNDADLIKRGGSTKVRVEGNCDEWGTDEYNYALGLKRANSVKDYLSKNGVEEGRLSLVSYGESNPSCSDHNKKCWDLNRRVEFKIIK